ncbi:MAG: tetratricopeptide repeat protein [Acidobacteria bacterium]|nr:tetratricopeptide repeat protein [Acidobacteriota bacterium]
MTRRTRRARIRLATTGVLLLLTAARGTAQTPNAYFEFLMARRLEALGDQAGALAALERAAAADPASAEVRAEIAAFQLRRDRRGEAETAAREALELNDGNLEAHRVLGLLYAAQADTINANAAPEKFLAVARDAIQHLERVAKEPTAGIDVLFSLGRLYLRTGSARPAVDTFVRVVTQNPGSAQARLFLAQAYAAAEDLKSAIETLDVIVEDEPRVASTLAQYQEQAGLFKEAVDNYTRALAVEPTNRGLKVRRITALIAAREYARAATLAAEAQAQHADDPRFPRLGARALVENGDVARALAVLEPSARAFPKDAATQFALADLYNDAGRDADAERTLRQILEIEPGNAQVLNYLGYLLAERGRQLDEAVRLVERALDLDPGNPYYLDSLGWAHFRRGDLDAAEKYLAPAATQLPRNGEVQNHLGDLLARRGRWAEAVEAWTRVLESEAGDVDRAEVQKKIEGARSRLPR